MIQNKKDFERVRLIENGYGGHYKIKLPEPPERKLIAGYDLPKSQQKFRPTVIPKDFSFLPESKQIEFVNQELDRRRDGYWFYNNGNIEYMTGCHYFYCSYWNLDTGGLPTWRYTNRDFFYVWDYCVKDPECYGLIYLTNRRDGKTNMGTCIMYEGISTVGDAHGGIQSKTGKDANDVFDKMIKSWRKLPDFWKPLDSGETSPKRSLRFEEVSRRSEKGRANKKNSLNSFIDHRPTVKTAYDGSALYRYYLDECGKIVEERVDQIWDIVKFCLTSDITNIRGKAILTSTVEEMTKSGGQYCFNIWKDSNPDEKTEVGRTKSGLYGYFKPAHKGLSRFFDEYGYADEYAAKSFLLKSRDTLKGASLSAEKRAFPLDIEEAFRVDNKESEFDLDRIYSQKDYNSGLNINLQQGNFVKQDDGNVMWIPSSTGKWLVSMFPEEPNKKTIRNGKLCPINNDFVSGCDPYDHNTTTDAKKSNGASFVFKRYNPMNSDSNIFVCQYINRPPTSEIFYEDMMNQCIFYGCKILCENNKIGLINYFRMKGMEYYLMDRPEDTHSNYSRKRQMEYGIPMSSPEARYALVRAIQTYTFENIGYLEEKGTYGRCDFNDLLDDWILFDIEKWTPFDATVASGLTLLAAKGVKEKKRNLLSEDAPYIKLYRNGRRIA